MASTQFTIRQLFVALTLATFSIALLTWLARVAPEVFIFACLGSIACGFFGASVLALAGAMSLSIYLSPENEGRKLNLAKCGNLALTGLIMMALPVATVIVTFVLIPIMGAT